MWPFDIKRKKREAEKLAEQRRLSEERLNAAVRRSGMSPAFSAPYGSQASRAAEPDSAPLFFGAGGYGGAETGRCSSHDSHTSASPSYDPGDSGGSDGGCGGGD